MNETRPAAVIETRLALGLFLGLLLFLSYRVLNLFLAPVTWAVILAFLTWPVYIRVRRWLGGRVNISALLMTLLLAGVFALPLFWIITMLRNEVPAVYHLMLGVIERGPEALPPVVNRIPWLGEEIRRLMELIAVDPAGLREQIGEWAKPWVDETLSILGDIGRTAFKAGFALLTAFFLYRDGWSVLDQARRMLAGFLGGRAGGYLRAIGDTTRAVLYGLVLTALMQGVLAGLGYWVAGVEAPALLGVLTAVLALVPFGAPVVWGLVSIGLLVIGETFAAIGLALWGAIIISQIDNLFRPLLISNATRIPYLLVLFGVIGGISAFGLVGLFLGPAVIAVLLAVWREWLVEHARNLGEESGPD